MEAHKLTEIIANSDQYKVCPFCEGINIIYADLCTTCNSKFIPEVPYHKSAKDRAKELLTEIDDDNITM